MLTRERMRRVGDNHELVLCPNHGERRSGQRKDTSLHSTSSQESEIVGRGGDGHPLPPDRDCFYHLPLLHLHAPVLGHVPRGEIVDGQFLRGGECKDSGAQGGHATSVWICQMESVMNCHIMELYIDAALLLPIVAAHNTDAIVNQKS